MGGRDSNQTAHNSGILAGVIVIMLGSLVLLAPIFLPVSRATSANSTLPVPDDSRRGRRPALATRRRSSKPGRVLAEEPSRRPQQTISPNGGAPAFAQTQRCGPAEPRQPRDDRIPGGRSSRRAPSRRCLWRHSIAVRPLPELPVAASRDRGICIGKRATPHAGASALLLAIRRAVAVAANRPLAASERGRGLFAHRPVAPYPRTRQSRGVRPISEGITQPATPARPADGEMRDGRRLGRSSPW